MVVTGAFLFAVSLSINLATILRANFSECARNSDLASRACWAEIRSWILLVGAVLIALISGDGLLCCV
jgi:hypothetical protein